MLWNRTSVMSVFVLGCLAASACGYSEKKFKNDYLANYCSAAVECSDGATGLVLFTDEAECEAFLGAFFGLGTAGCDYDGKAAKTCVADIEAADCAGLNAITSCNDVYSGDTCGWGTDGDSETTLSDELSGT